MPPVTLRALTDVLTGKVAPMGRLPVTVPGKFIIGDGLGGLTK